MIFWGSAGHHARVSSRRKSRGYGRRQCLPGVCPRPCTHEGTANGVCLILGCEFHVAMWRRDPTELMRAVLRARGRSTCAG